MVNELITDPLHIRSAGWQKFIDSHPDGNVFQSPVMFDLWSATENAEPLVIGSIDRDGRLSGILLAVILREFRGPLGYFSSRCVVYGGPLVSVSGHHSEANNQIANDLLSTLISLVKSRSIFIQFRNFRDMSCFRPAFESLGFSYRDRLNIVIQTHSQELTFSNMSESRKRQVRQGLRNGATTGPAKGLEEVGQYYVILEKLYREKVKKPLPKWTFFRSFFELSQEEGLGVILLVKRNNRVIGGILCPVTPGKSIYEWYVCGLDREFPALHPSVLATWAGLEYASTHNIPQFDFLGVGLPDKPYGVREFKSRFGGDTVNYGRFARINKRWAYFLAELGFNFLSALKKI